MVGMEFHYYIYIVLMWGFFWGGGMLSKHVYSICSCLKGTLISICYICTIRCNLKKQLLRFVLDYCK